MSRKKKQLKQTDFADGGDESWQSLIPEGLIATPDPYEMPGTAKWLVLGDVHAPFHDKSALELAINYGLEEGCDSIYMNGDGADNHEFSRWFKKMKLDPEEEIRVAKTVIKAIQQPFQRQVYKIGNHDERWNIYLQRNHSKFAHLKSMQFIRQFELEEMGWEIVDSMQIGMIGNMAICHGHELAKGFIAPVNPARGAFLRVKDSMVVNHYHKTSAHPERSGVDGKLIICRSIGCLCNLRPDYSAITNWNWGFAVVQVNADSSFQFTNYLITEDYDIARL